jgi:hypothetical protein
MMIHHLVKLRHLNTVLPVTKTNKTNSVSLSPQANYTDWATAACWRNLVPTFVDRGVMLGQRSRSPTVVNLSFLDRSRYFSFKVAPHLASRGRVDPVSDPLLRRKFGSHGNRTQDFWVSSQELWPLDHTGGHTRYRNENWRMYFLYPPRFRS